MREPNRIVNPVPRAEWVQIPPPPFFYNMEARKAGVLIGLENRDGPYGPWEFDPLRLR